MRLLRDLGITGVTADSRRVAPGFLFAALPGARQDGAAFIPEAVARGAAAVLAPPGVTAEGVRVITDAHPRRRFAKLAAAFHRVQPAAVAAVTGTNGKTSVAGFTRQIWTLLGLPAASLGTLGLTAPGVMDDVNLTTPDPETLHATLADLARRGVDWLAMEASSHGLAQYRLDGVRLAAGAFTNISRDHLDYHGTMDAYLAAKARLFSELLPAGAPAVLNADSSVFDSLAETCRVRGLDIIDYGRAARRIRLIETQARGDGQDLLLEVDGSAAAVRLPLAGDFQAMNALCALGIVLGLGADTARAVSALSALEGLPGRLQLVARTPANAAVYVDYAHTPDALDVVLRALRPHASNRLVVVFGCGGDRDPGKRPLMGSIAAHLADAVFITDDNPRGEDPAPIRRQIMSACPGAVEIGDRRAAIRAAMASISGGDVLVVAGKGHERGQIVGDVVLPFDDADEIRRAVAETGS